MSWPPSIDELVPTDMSYASVDATPNHCDLYVVDLDTQKVMDGVQSVDIKEGVAYCLLKFSSITIIYKAHNKGEVTYTGCQDINVSAAWITFNAFKHGIFDINNHRINLDLVESYSIDDTGGNYPSDAIPVLGRYQIFIMGDCRHGFIVREIQEHYRFRCKECNTRFRSYPTVRRK